MIVPAVEVMTVVPVTETALLKSILFVASIVSPSSVIVPAVLVTSSETNAVRPAPVLPTSPRNVTPALPARVKTSLPLIVFSKVIVLTSEVIPTPAVESTTGPVNPIAPLA